MARHWIEKGDTKDDKKIVDGPWMSRRYYTHIRNIRFAHVVNYMWMCFWNDCYSYVECTHHRTFITISFVKRIIRFCQAFWHRNEDIAPVRNVPLSVIRDSGHHRAQ